MTLASERNFWNPAKKPASIFIWSCSHFFYFVRLVVNFTNIILLLSAIVGLDSNADSIKHFTDYRNITITWYSRLLKTSCRKFSKKNQFYMISGPPIHTTVKGRYELFNVFYLRFIKLYDNLYIILIRVQCLRLNFPFVVRTANFVVKTDSYFVQMPWIFWYHWNLQYKLNNNRND